MPDIFSIKQLPYLFALRFHNQMSSGANKPILITAVDKEKGKHKECVTKLMGAERMRPEAAAFELLASFIAWEWKIFVVEPVLIEISPNFVETLRRTDSYITATKSIGLNYGSIYERNYQTLPALQKLNKNQILQAQKIFAFDVFISNVDRTFNKPNSMFNADEIIIYDHELSFSFLYNILPASEPWNISDSDRTNWIEKMFLFPKIKGILFPEKEILRCLDRFNNKFWQKASSLIPQEWQTDHFFKIQKTLNLIVNHKKLFVRNLKWVVA